jgi:penicillin-binding protein 1A
MNKKKSFLSYFKIFLIVAASTTILFSIATGLFVYKVYKGSYGNLPDYQELKNVRNNTASEVYSSDGVLLGKYYIINRTNSKFEEISPHIVDALISTEDIRFFNHQGIDKKSLARVLIKSLILGNDRSGGGSTISQQLAKNLFQRNQYPYLSMAINKIKEAITAYRLEKIYTKQEILTLYLNTVSFGEDVYGIEVAAERYFKTTPAKITLSEAATLIGMLKATTYYNPRAKPENAMQRRNIVLGQMAKYNFIDKSLADSIRQQPLGLNYTNITHNDGIATYFREMLRMELQRKIKDYKKPDGAPYNIYTDGLKIYTSIHSRAQLYAENALRDHIKNLQEKFDESNSVSEKTISELANTKKLECNRYKNLKNLNYSSEQIDKNFNTPVKMQVFTWNGPNTRELSPLDSIKYYQQFLNAGLLAMEPSSGNVIAWVGGIDFKYFKYDHIRSKRQAGSTFKPVVYAAALEDGIDPCEYISNEKSTYEQFENWSPRNPDHVYDGYYSMQGALMRSVNTVSARLIQQTGTNSVIKLAQKLGITGELPAVPSIALGSANVSLEEMVTAYTTFPNRGYRRNPVYLLKIEDATGNVIYEKDSAEALRFRAMKSETADIMTHFLKSVVDSGTASGIRNIYGLKNEIGGKTGTTQNYADGWFIGFTPDLIAGVWVGHENPKIHFRSSSMGQGSKTALPIWANFMKVLFDDIGFEEMKKGRFHALSERAKERINCPSYKELREEPHIWEDLFKKDSKKKKRKEQSGENRKRFFNILKKKKGV